MFFFQVSFLYPQYFLYASFNIWLIDVQLLYTTCLMFGWTTAGQMCVLDGGEIQKRERNN